MVIMKREKPGGLKFNLSPPDFAIPILLMFY